MEVINCNACPTQTAPDGTIVQELISPRNSRAATHSLAFIEVGAGVRVAPHRHLRSEEVYHLQEGSGMMYLAGETHRLRAGDTVVIKPGEVHSLRNDSDKPIKMVVTCVPPWIPEDQVSVELEGF